MEMRMPGIAYQVYSVRDEAQKDLRAALAVLKGQGYEGVEFAGYYGHSAEDVASMLNELGLKAASSHVPLKQLQEDPDGVIAYHKTLGCRYIAIPYVEEAMRPGRPGFAALIAFCWEFGKQCKDAGMRLMYHNHDFEFEQVSGSFGLDFLYEAVSPDLLATQQDTCWVKYAGIDPVEYLRKYSGRAPVVHLKDFVGFKGEHSPYQLIGMEDNPDAGIAQFSYRPLGYGVQDVKALTRAAIEAGAQWLVIEQDESPDRPVFEASQMSIDTLRKILGGPA